MKDHMMRNIFYYGMALLLLPVLIYMFIVIIFGEHSTREVRGCGRGCKGNCRMSRNAKKIRELNIVFVKMERCVHCKRLQELLDANQVSNLVQNVDSNSKNVEDLSKRYGEIEGFPTLISLTTGKKITGGRGRIEDIINELM